MIILLFFTNNAGGILVLIKIELKDFKIKERLSKLIDRKLDVKVIKTLKNNFL